jgi:predicted transcriptional regulator
MVIGHDRSVHERIDRSCDLLSSAYRRRVIYTLRKDGTASVGELAEALVSAGVADVRERAVASLVHAHLPKLAEVGVVEYDDPNDNVSLTGNVELLEPFLRVAAREEVETENWSFPIRTP